MKNLGTWLSTIGLVVSASLASVSTAPAQDLFREMDQLKREMSELRKELSELRGVVYQLRRAVLKSVASPEDRTPPKVAAKEENAVQAAPALDEKQATRVICQSVGKFFSDAESILNAGDSSTANARMRQAVRNLNSTLQSYANMHRVAKILNIYEGLAWDAYVAVELRQSVSGNQEFLEALNNHKRKYVETCPKE